MLVQTHTTLEQVMRFQMGLTSHVRWSLQLFPRTTRGPRCRPRGPPNLIRILASAAAAALLLRERLQRSCLRGCLGAARGCDGQRLLDVQPQPAHDLHGVLGYWGPRHVSPSLHALRHEDPQRRVA